MEQHTPHLLSDDLQRRMSHEFEPGHVMELANTRYVDVPFSDEQLAYGRVNEGQGVPTLFVPGFSEGVTSKAPFALELARPGDSHDGLDIILPDQQRQGMHLSGQVNERGKPVNEATHTQALGYMAVLEREVENGPVNIITHSYGSLVFQAMTKIAAERAETTGRNILDGANVVMLAPGGSYENESMPRLMGRFVKYVLSETVSHKAFPDQKNEQMKAGLRHIFKNFRRSWHEARALASERVDYPALMGSGIGSLAVMAYAEDKLFSYKQLDESMEQAIEAGATYMTPVHFDPELTAKLTGIADEAVERLRAKGVESDRTKFMTKKISVLGATHNDEQFNPKRVAGAVKQHLGLVQAA